MSRKIVNGLLMDCARTIERHDYYFKLVDFMADWKMNILLLHFTDDQGCAIQLPGFPRLAMKNAFSAAEIRSLIKYAAKKGIEIIPELETFGHARYLTDKSKYSYLYAGKKSDKVLTFNAIDPLSLDSVTLMRSLIKSVAKLFPSKYLHIGCDEVNLEEYCKVRGGIEPGKVWAGYVNKIIGVVKDNGKIPMLWADHLVSGKKEAGLLRKDVIAVRWNYIADTEEKYFKILKKAGFKDVYASPSVACNDYRFLTAGRGLENVIKMSKFTAKNKLKGFINTIWCPYRYIQGAVYYGIAFGSYSLTQKGNVKLQEFNKLFAQKVFGTAEDKHLNEFLLECPNFDIDNMVVGDMFNRGFDWVIMTPEHRKKMLMINKLGKELLSKMETAAPVKNIDIWESMLLAVKAAWLFSEHFVITKNKIKDKERIKKYKSLLKKVTLQASKDWDKTRFPEDPQKYGGKFPDECGNYALLILRELRKL